MSGATKIPSNLSAASEIAGSKPHRRRAAPEEADTPAVRIRRLDRRPLRFVLVAARRSIQLQDRFEPALEDFVLHAVLVVYAAAKLALDLDVRALLQTRAEFAEFPEGISYVE
jgi:hypothetical protein